jgi:hypothetical protein
MRGPFFVAKESSRSSYQESRAYMEGGFVAQRRVGTLCGAEARHGFHFCQAALFLI